MSLPLEHKRPGTATSSSESPAVSPDVRMRHLRARTNTAEIDSAITHPGSVKINVQGAFIVDVENASPHEPILKSPSHDTKDIRLPNHTAVVSHIAVDVGSHDA